MGDLSRIVPILFQGLPTTVIAAVGGIVLTIVLAFPAGLALLSEHRWLRTISRVYVEVFRGTSEVVQLFWIYFVLPLLVGIQLIPLVAGIIVLGLNHGAYGAEIVRGAVQSVPRAQVEGAIALNMSPAQRMRRVILPQAIAEMLPPFNNLFIQLLKSTAILSLIPNLEDVTRQGRDVLVPNFGSDIVLIFTVMLLIYLVLALMITTVMRLAERAAARRLGRRVSSVARMKAADLGGIAAGGGGH